MISASGDLHPGVLQSITSEVSPRSYTGDIRPLREFSAPSIDWQSWFPESDGLEFAEGFLPLLPQTSQSTTASEGSDELEQSVGQVSPTSGIDKNGWYPLPPNNIALPLPGQTYDFAMDERDQVDSEEREHVPKCAETSGLALRRAKNRTAASKCRAKQKKNAKGLQEAYEQISGQNAYLKRQERILRGLITSLRDCALQHDSTRCRCTSLHAFNKKRAERIFQDMNSSDR